MTATTPLPLSNDPVAIASLATLGALLLLAAASDLAARRIPNALVVAGLVLAAAVHAAALAAGERPLAGASIAAPLAGLLAGGVALLPMYLLRGCAAGDVKLMAMAGAFLGAAVALEAVLATLVAGGVLSLAMLARPRVAAAAWRRLRTPRPGADAVDVAGSGITPLSRTAYRLPYAPAIAIGVAFAAWRHLAAA